MALTDEELLQFLVAVVDAELFETVGVKHLEPVDVEDPDDSSSFLNIRHVYHWVDLVHNPGEQSIVHSLHEKTVSLTVNLSKI